MPKTFTIGNYTFRFGLADDHRTHLWMWNGYYYSLVPAECSTLAEAMTAARRSIP